MRYSQISTSRLSKAARKLTADGEWHPFGSVRFGWYRISNGRLVQRATFESQAEESALLPLVMKLEPIADMSGHSGFREELVVKLVNDRLELVASLGKTSADSAAARRVLKSHNVTLDIQGNLTSAHIPIPELTSEALADARSAIAEVRLSIDELIDRDRNRD